MDASIPVLTIAAMGTVFGLLALWQAKAAQKRIARLRAEEDRLAQETQPAA